MSWIDIKNRLPSDEESVLVLQGGNDVCSHLVIQAQLFEGEFYPDHMDGLVDFDDRLVVKFWQPLPKPPKGEWDALD